MPPTIKEVAERAGVSVSTVSRVLNDYLFVSDAARRRVVDAMEALEYRPDVAARSMRTGSSRTVGFVVSDISNPLFATIAKGVDSVLVPHGYSLVLANSENDPEHEAGLLSALRQRRLDGLIAAVADERAPGSRSGWTASSPSSSTATPGSNADAVWSDHDAGVAEALERLAGLGHHRVALIAGSEGQLGSRARTSRSGAMRAGSLSIGGLVRSAEPGREGGELAARQLLASADRPTALLIGHNLLTAGILVALTDLGVRVPDDLSVIACDDVDVTRLFSPPIDVIERDLLELGRCSAQLLLDRLGGEGASPLRVVLPTHLVTRQHRAAARTGGSPGGMSTAIADIRIHAISVPLERAFWMSVELHTVAAEIVVEVEIEAGHVGIGEIHGRPQSAIIAILQHFRSRLVGEDALDHERLYDIMFRSTFTRTAAGFEAADGQPHFGAGAKPQFMAAIAGIDIALWDIKGKAAVCRSGSCSAGAARGAGVRERGYYGPDGQAYVDELVAEMVGYAALGFDGVKLKVGGLSIAEASRGPQCAKRLDTVIMLDANSAYDVPTAIEAAHAFEPFGIRWLEEPVAWFDPVFGSHGSAPRRASRSQAASASSIASGAAISSTTRRSATSSSTARVREASPSGSARRRTPLSRGADGAPPRSTDPRPPRGGRRERRRPRGLSGSGPGSGLDRPVRRAAGHRERRGAPLRPARVGLELDRDFVQRHPAGIAA